MRVYFSIIFLLFFSRSQAQNDTTAIELKNITVSANISGSEILYTGRNITVIDQKTIALSPVKTLDGILQYALNVDVRSRSSAGVQADISIRGGHYDQTLILIDGIKMNDPQTGHHSLNIPIAMSQIEKIEILQGGASRVFGPSAFSGVINIITKKIDESKLGFLLGAGQFGQLSGSLYGQSVYRNFYAAVFSEGLKGDGYALNTAFKKKSLNFQLGKHYNKGTLDLRMGLMDNKFGASNFYSPKFYNQYEEVAATTANATWNHNFSNKLHSTMLANYRKHNDVYDFNNFRNSANKNSVNYHQTDVIDMEWKFKYLSKLGKTAFGVEYRNEKVISNRLGETLEVPIAIKNQEGLFYSKSKTRDNLSAFIEQQININRFNVASGVLINYNSQFGVDYYPGLDVSYALNGNSSLYSSINKSLRFPTFTELYLNTATLKADPNLKPEQALAFEVGYKNRQKLINNGISVFYRKTQNALDKVKRPTVAVPTMENIDNINMFGIEYNSALDLSQMLNTKFIKNLTLNYAYLQTDKKENGFQSFYTLNYLRHKLSTGLLVSPIENLNINLWYTYKFRQGDYQLDAASPIIIYKPVKLFDCRASYKFSKYAINLDANNIFNYKYYEFGFVEQPGRWLSLSFGANF